MPALHRTPALVAAGREDRERAVAAGFDRHAAKPIEPEAPVRLVAELAGRV